MREQIKAKTADFAAASWLRSGLSALAIMAGLGVAPALAGGGLSVGLGGLGGVSVGGGSVADVDVSVGDVDVEASVGGSGNVASGCVGDCDGTSGSVGVSIGAGGVTASVGTGTTTTGGPTPGTPPGVAAFAATTVPNTSVVKPKKLMRCATDGNSQVYNGYTVVDREGRPIGVVHDTRLAPDLKISGLRVETVRNRCVGLEGGNYKVSDGRVWVNVDGARFR